MKASLYDGSFGSCLGYLLKRLVLLAAKLLGFKGFCLFLATLLLCLGRVGEDVWLTLVVTLVCSASGIRVLDSMKEGSEALDAKELISAKLGKLGKRAKPGVFAGRRNGKTEVYDENFYDGIWKSDGNGHTGGAASALPYPGGGSSGQAFPPFGGPAGGGWADGGNSAAGGDPDGKPADGRTGGSARRAAERKGRRASVRAARSAGEKGRERIREALEAAVRPGS